MSQDSTQYPTQEVVRRVVIRRGLLYGAIIAALDALAAIGAWLSLSPSSALPFALPGLGASDGSNYRLTILAIGIGAGVVGLATLALPFFLGMSVYKRVRRIGAGALAGLVAGGVGGVIGALAILALTIFALMTPASSLYGVPYSGFMPIWVSVANIVFGLVWQCGLGAGLGQKQLGYTFLFVWFVVFCVLGTVTVRYIKGVKR